MLYFYIYKITLTQEKSELYGHVYYGSRCSKILPELDKYKGSSSIIKKTKYFIKYPYDYKKEILKYCETIEELIEEEKLIIKENINNPLCLNIIAHSSNHNTFIKQNKEQQQERSKRISEAKKGKKHKINENIKEEYIANLSLINKNVEKSKEWKENISKGKKGKKLTDIHKQHISEGMKKRIFYPHNEDTKFKISLKNQEYYSNKENREKISELTKKAMQNEEIKKKCSLGGYITGKKIHINNGIISKRINEEELEHYLELGYVRGRIYKRH